MLWPKPASCGKTNHIQWDCWCPAVSSLTTWVYTEACASMKRTRSESVTRALGFIDKRAMIRFAPRVLERLFIASPIGLGHWKGHSPPGLRINITLEP